MQQMMENPQLMQNMLSAPYTQSMLQAFAADPNMAAQIVNSNPLFADNPALQVSIQTCNNMSYLCIWDFHAKKLGACTMWPVGHVRPV
jgi:hypothetical protein